jgi:hypothetical protein
MVAATKSMWVAPWQRGIDEAADVSYADAQEQQKTIKKGDSG